MPTRSVIVDAVRSPMGRGKSTGALAGLHPADLLAQVLSALVDRSSLDPALVDDVLIGCVGGAGEQSATPGRQALLAAGLADVGAVGDDRTQVRVRSAGGRVRRGRHRRRPLRHRGRRRRGVDEPGADGLGADGRGSVRRRRAGAIPGSRAAGRLGRARRAAVRPQPNASWTSTPRARTRGRSRPASTAGSRTRSLPSSPAVRR